MLVMVHPLSPHTGNVKNVSANVKKTASTTVTVTVTFLSPDCDIGWDSSRDCFYRGYDLYMLVDSQSDLPVFPHYSYASKHDSLVSSSFFRMRAFLRITKVSKVLLDSAHDAMPLLSMVQTAKHHSIY